MPWELIHRGRRTLTIPTKARDRPRGSVIGAWFRSFAVPWPWRRRPCWECTRSTLRHHRPRRARDTPCALAWVFGPAERSGGATTRLGLPWGRGLNALDPALGAFVAPGILNRWWRGSDAGCQGRSEPPGESSLRPAMRGEGVPLEENEWVDAQTEAFLAGRMYLFASNFGQGRQIGWERKGLAADPFPRRQLPACAERSSSRALRTTSIGRC